MVPTRSLLLILLFFLLLLLLFLFAKALCAKKCMISHSSNKKNPNKPNCHSSKCHLQSLGNPSWYISCRLTSFWMVSSQDTQFTKTYFYIMNPSWQMCLSSQDNEVMTSEFCWNEYDNDKGGCDHSIMATI